eukprot:TRINITY_DN3069_c0_g1_i1.p2 TRINITY_DN3069_c0_g1~~TRINITY_DN3069_c0_g1_i1.p2  ORF type:complete len:236 (+),score=3.45 TRINITY_DN3069_c0_g1_i1:604-1311(+)
MISRHTIIIDIEGRIHSLPAKNPAYIGFVHSSIKTDTTINLSATGSKKAPNLDEAYITRAKYPSSQSVNAAIIKIPPLQIALYQEGQQQHPIKAGIIAIRANVNYVGIVQNLFGSLVQRSPNPTFFVGPSFLSTNVEQTTKASNLLCFACFDLNVICRSRYNDLNLYQQKCEQALNAERDKSILLKLIFRIVCYRWRQLNQIYFSKQKNYHATSTCLCQLTSIQLKVQKEQLVSL